MNRRVSALVLACLAIVFVATVTGCTSGTASGAQGASSSSTDFAKAPLTPQATTTYLQAKVPALDNVIIGDPIVGGNVVVEWVPQSLDPSQFPVQGPIVANKVTTALFANPAVKTVTFEIASNAQIVFRVDKKR